MENVKYKYQSSSTNFNFIYDDETHYWEVSAKQISRRSEDDENWQRATIAVKIYDKKVENTVMTIWEIFNNIQKECKGDIFNYKEAVLENE